MPAPCYDRDRRVHTLANKRKAFVAYPSNHPEVVDAIRGAVELSVNGKLKLEPWEHLPIIGLKIDNLIRDKIRDADALVADITFPNFNVYYEMGYAISQDKPVIPVANLSIQNSAQWIQQIGLLDTIGYIGYDNSKQLNKQLKSWSGLDWTGNFRRSLDHAQPLFILDSLKKTNFRNYIFSTVVNNSVKFRSLDPDETPRLTAATAIAEMSSSSGAIIPILSPDIVDSEKHNLRAAFLAGLAHGFEVDPLIIQYANGPAPLDFRDFITNTASRAETERHIADYCAEVLIRNQRSAGVRPPVRLGLLSSVDLGASAAERETEQLSAYFVQTAEYSRAMRGESAVVSGRKGSGKSAIFFRVRDEYSRDKNIHVVELRPAAHNLSELRQELMKVVEHGVFDHTIAAFWHYIIYVELLLSVREIALKKSRRDFSLQRRIAEMEERFSLTDEIVAGDFTSRLQSATNQVVEFLEEADSPQQVRHELTNILYERSIPELRDCLLSFQEFFGDIVLLIDDLDKGWPPRRLEEYDVRMLRHLIEVLNRIQRDLRRKDVRFKYLMFIRSDVYDNLVEQTADRGKYNLIGVDWSDPAQLEHLLKERVTTSVDARDRDDAWTAFNTELRDGSHAVDHLIRASLYRPRFLIEVAERALSFAINRGHPFITEEDLQNGLEKMSLYLVSDFGYEMRDVAGTSEGIFYAFIGASDLLTEAEIGKLLRKRWPEIDVPRTIELLLWYGFLGLVGEANIPVFIFDRGYDFRRLMAEGLPEQSENLFGLNPAFIRGLQPE